MGLSVVSLLVIAVIVGLFVARGLKAILVAGAVVVVIVTSLPTTTARRTSGVACNAWLGGLMQRLRQDILVARAGINSGSKTRHVLKPEG